MRRYIPPAWAAAVVAAAALVMSEAAIGAVIGPNPSAVLPGFSQPVFGGGTQAGGPTIGAPTVSVAPGSTGVTGPGFTTSTSGLTPGLGAPGGLSFGTGATGGFGATAGGDRRAFGTTRGFGAPVVDFTALLASGGAQRPASEGMAMDMETLRGQIIDAEPGLIRTVEPSAGFDEGRSFTIGLGLDGTGERFGEVGLPRSTEPFPGVGADSPAGITTTVGRTAPTPTAAAGGLVLLGLLGIARRRLRQRVR